MTLPSWYYRTTSTVIIPCTLVLDGYYGATIKRLLCCCVFVLVRIIWSCDVFMLFHSGHMSCCIISMLHHVASCYFISHHIVSPYFVLLHVALSYFLLYPCCSRSLMLSHVMLCHDVSFHIIVCRITSVCVNSCLVLLFHLVLCYFKTLHCRDSTMLLSSDKRSAIITLSCNYHANNTTSMLLMRQLWC